MQITRIRCPDCQVEPGQNHEEGCDYAQCPDCGEQLLLHECEHWEEDAEGPDRPPKWHGVAPRAEVARTMNWWTTHVGIDHLVEDYTRVLYAIVLGQVVWDRQEQRYTFGWIDEAAIDASMTKAR